MSSPPRPPVSPPGTAPPTLAQERAEGESLYRFAGTVTFFTLLSRILGMVRDLSISHFFGASGATDAWVQAFRIPNALRRLTAEGSMTIAFVPVYVEIREQQGRAAALAFARKVLGLVLLVTLALCTLGVVFSVPLTALFSPGYRDEPRQLALTALFTRWTFPYLVLVSVVAWSMGVLNAEKRFAAPAAAPILLNLGIIGAVLGLARYFEVPAFAIAVGILIGGAGQVLLQLPSLLRVGLVPLPARGMLDADVRRLFRLLGPALLGVAVYQINIFILGILASYLPTGQVFDYNNATRLTELVMGLFTFAFTTAGLPTLSEHHVRGDWGKVSHNVRFTFAAVAFTILPATVGLTVAAQPIVAMLYLHGAYHLADVATTARTLQCMALGMPAVAAVRVMVPVYYAFGDSRTPVAISTLAVCVTASLGWWLSQGMQVAGLALGLSLGTWFQALAMFWRLQRAPGELRAWFPWRSLGLQGLAAVAMGLGAAWGVTQGAWERGPFSAHNWLVFLLTLGGSAALYAGLTLALREEQAWHWARLGQRLGRRVRRLAAFRPGVPR